MFKKITTEQIEKYGFNSICDLGEAYFHENTENFYIYNENFFVVKNEEGFLVCVKKHEKPEYFYIKKESRKIDHAFSVYQTDMLSFVSSFSEKFDEVTVSKNEEGKYLIVAETKIKTTDKMILEFIAKQIAD